MHENRETSSVFPASGDRSGKAQSRTPDMHAGEESDRAVSTREAAEQGGASLSGGGGGKGVSQGEPRSASHAPDTVREHACSRGRPVCGGRRCASRYYPRQEPYAVVPLVRICAGGGQQ
jgi:hypothetical protein